LEEELVYVGDGGSTEVSGRTQRIGVDVELRLQVTPWLWLDADLSLARGRYTDEPDGADRIPLAPTLGSTGGVTVVHPSGIDGSVRFRGIGSRPANESGSVIATGFAIASASMGYRFSPARVYVLIENILGNEWNEAQFDTESRLKGEPFPVSEIHFTPGVPRNIQVGISVEF
jgi:outer membrane receptor protein involved in Fe transport